MRHSFYGTLILLLTSSNALAQHSCPDGFTFAGTLSGAGSAYSALNERRELNLPAGATLDTSYQQATVRARDGNRRSQSNLRAEDIPKGIHMSAAGTTSLDRGWAISEPELKQVQSRYRFSMK